MALIRVVAGLTLVAAACGMGTPAHKFDAARGPAGVTVDLRLAQRGRVRGELLAVGDSALIVRGPAIALVRYASIRSGVFRDVGAVSFDGRAPQPRDRERLRQVSRFPQGLSPELMQRLLQAHGQNEPSVY